MTANAGIYEAGLVELMQPHAQTNMEPFRQSWLLPTIEFLLIATLEANQSELIQRDLYTRLMDSSMKPG